MELVFLGTHCWEMLSLTRISEGGVTGNVWHGDSCGKSRSNLYQLESNISMPADGEEKLET